MLSGCGSGGASTPSIATVRAYTPQPSQTTGPARPFKPPQRVFAVARAFIRAAVLRTDLARSWRLTSPSLHENLTEQQWLSGNIPVVPFPKADFLAARYRIVQASPHDVVLEVLIVPRARSVLAPTTFFMRLVQDTSRWLVSYWAPRGGGAGLASPND